MTFDEKASQVRNEADKEAIAQLLAQYSWGKDVGPRPAGTVPDSSADLDSLTSEPIKRKLKLEKRIQTYRATLARSIAKHDDLKRRGLDEVGDYDLMVCYSGSPLNACRHTMELHEAHISYDLSILEILDRELSKLDVSIPPGFVLVDAVLPAHQAFQVRKWAESAKTRLNQARAKARMDTRTEKRDSE
ncbi:hypothetical protein D3C76_1031830 [compost metagenome]|uniref:Uncharacterized protein n=1 Tax=Pseudomonas helleri TaxID=1608996 RepID=A0A7X1WUB6_9PSED|nr:hypothetical protein [Pseudomonas helleri]MQT74817.1 hypothetical protein [Pseudomonas helleri]BCT99976.1 hypothetical protein [uncultured bacterium]